MKNKDSTTNIKDFIIIITCYFLCFFSNCTLVFEPATKNVENKVKIAPVTLDSILSNPEKYGGYGSRYTDILKEKYFESKVNARQEYIKVIAKAESLGIEKSPYLDTCCYHISEIDSLLKENTRVKYCDSIKKERILILNDSEVIKKLTESFRIFPLPCPILCEPYTGTLRAYHKILL